MNTNIYFIIGGVAIAFIIYMVVLQNMMKKRKAQQLENFNSNHSGNPLTEEQKRLLTFGAILFYHRGEKILGISPEGNLDVITYGLKQQWEISNSEEAKETLNDLLMLQRSTEFEPLFQQSSPELSKIQKNIAKGLGLDLAIVEQTKSAFAWDICRAVSLAKWCYWCGYITETETFSIMEQAAKTANQLGQNWTDYTVSFLLGRTIQGFDLDDVIITTKQILHSQNPALRKMEDIDVYQKYSFK
ncbi:DUF1266 domain-containing protein [Paenimyroides aestuarii]|uniref:DUF1266 domain-containing protein n=1 Tax=Paenimyroides aestuarii TaxID=2968490 RepID=A0ABY5NQM9_9FLAO|nr:DUF1266 domain-containing protein [Paenimyroides aestuarii]UUV20860.1 DUF1266 domain-containing protein [Paenimyroides aestuarii]